MNKKVIFAISTLSGGGAERVVSVWTKQLYERGFDVSIVLFGRTEGEYAVPSGIKIYTIANTYEEYTKLNYVVKVYRMRKLIKNIRPDITVDFLPRVQAIMLLATLGTKIKRIETIRVNPWAITDKKVIAKIIWRICFLMSIKIIVQTPEQALFFGNRLREKCVVISNPISDLYVNGKVKQYNSPVKKFVAVGRIDRQKNYELMIKSFVNAKKRIEAVREISLDIFGAGDYDYQLELQSLIRELNAESYISLRGRVNDLHERLAEYDAYLMTSDYEGMPNSLAEAMMLGLVCISTDCKTGPKDMIESGVSGFLTKTGNAEEYEEKILYITKLDVEQLASIGKIARQSIKNITDFDVSIERLIRILRV